MVVVWFQKFFLRCLKHGNMKYVCSKSQDCKITKESRTQCQFCRYQKCFKVGMHKPGKPLVYKNDLFYR